MAAMCYWCPPITKHLPTPLSNKIQCGTYVEMGHKHSGTSIDKKKAKGKRAGVYLCWAAHKRDSYGSSMQVQ